MAGRFRFEPLLDIARQREEQQMRVLAEAIAAQEAEQRRLDGLVALHEELTSGLCARKTTGTLDAARHAETVAYLEHLDGRIASQREAVDARAEVVDAARAALTAALQEKRSLELLEERDAAEAAQAESRREDRRVDDLNTQRYRRPRTGGE